MMTRLFAWFVRLFPRDFRAAYGDGMREVYLDQLADARSRGRVATIRVAIWMCVRMPRAAWRERRAERARHRGAGVRGLPGDLRLTLRALVRSPGFAAITVLVIAIGIGGVATIASGLNALVLRPLPGTADGLALYTIERRSEDFSEGVSMSPALYDHFAGAATKLDGLAAWSRVPLSMRIGDASVAVPGVIVSPNYFDVLGLRPLVGRFFAGSEPESTLVVSHRLWRVHFAQSPDVIGRHVTLNGRPYRIVGVAPPGFRGVFTPLRIDAWVPLSAQPHVRPTRDLRDAPWLWMFGRLAADATVEQARIEMRALLSARTVAGQADRHPDYMNIRFTPLTGLPDDARQMIFGFAGVLLAAAAVVLLVAGANVSSLLATRATTRRHEMGLRTALGASRGRLVRQLLTETLVLFVLGSAGGLLVAWAGTSALEALAIPGDSALALELSPDLRIVTATAMLGLIAGVIFGIGPAMRGTSQHPAKLIRESTAGSGTRRGRLGSALIVCQLAGSLVLLTTTSLLGGALARGGDISTGFNSRGVFTTSFNTEAYGYDADRGREFYEELRLRLTETPGISRVSFAQVAPLVAIPANGIVSFDGHDHRVRQTVVGAGFFDALGIRIHAGRAFAPADREGAGTVAVVSRTFVQRVLAGVPDAVGRTFMRRSSAVTIVGVVDDVKWGSLAESAMPFVYYALPQQWQSGQTLFVTAAPGVPAVGRLVADVVRGIDSTIPEPVVIGLDENTQAALLPQRVATMVTIVLGAGALVLSCAGLYGAIAWMVAVRHREIGVRLALGATRSQVIRMFLAEGLRLTAVAVAIGLIGAAGAAQVVSGLLLGGPALDPRAFAVGALILAITAAFAAWLPARRATTVDPVSVLR